MEENEQEELFKKLAKTDKVCLIAAAGCGKTHSISQALSYCDGLQLVLTHTNRGVHAIKEKLKKNKIHPGLYRVETISAFFKRYLFSYPIISGVKGLAETDENYWDKIYEAGLNFFKTNLAKMILQNTYSGIFVDEYQDCNINQHNAILEISKYLPVRVFGDPLQGIYDIGSNKGQLVDLDKKDQLLPGFEFFVLEEPWRWKENESLGDWLKTVRQNLINGDSINLVSLPTGINFVECTKTEKDIKKRSECLSMLSKDGTILVIDIVDNVCHSLAKNLDGRFQSDEEIHSKDLFSFAKELDNVLDIYEAIDIIFDLAAKCFTKFRTELGNFQDKLKDERHVVNSKKYPKLKEVLEKMIQGEKADNNSMIELMNEIVSLKPGSLFRGELWRDAIRTISDSNSEEGLSFILSACRTRSIRSITGKPLSRKIISRTHLVKGLEFDHVLILCPEALNKKNLYVALTRARKSVTILSTTSILNPRA